MIKAGPSLNVREIKAEFLAVKERQQEKLWGSLTSGQGAGRGRLQTGVRERRAGPGQVVLGGGEGCVGVSGWGGVGVGGCCKGTRHCLCTFHPATSVESDRPETALAAD